MRLADQLRAAGLLDADDDRYRLVHPLVASALYAGLPPGDRALRHARAAQVLESEHADPELIALHLLHTQPGRVAATVATLRVAARRASLRGAPESAAVFLRRALAEPPPDRGVQAEVACELGLALAAHVQPGARELLVEAVDLATTPDQRSRIALHGARALGLAGYFDEAMHLCRRGATPADGIAPELLSRLEAELACNAWLHVETVADARERVRQNHPSRVAPYQWRVHAAWRAVCEGRPAAEPRDLLLSVFESKALDEEPDSMIGTPARRLLLQCGEPEATIDFFTDLVEVARPRGWLIALAHASLVRASALVVAGRIREAEADGRLAFTFKLGTSPVQALTWSLFPFVDALIELDELFEAEAALGAAGMLGDPPPGALGTPHVLERRARLRLAQHRPALAHADLMAAAAWWQEFGIHHPGFAPWRALESEALVALDDVDGARRLAEEHLALAERVGLPGPRAAGLRALARTATAMESIELLEQAVDLLAGTSQRLEYTRALVDLGAALRRANHRDAARDPLRRALALAERGGMRLLARRAHQELAATGARPRRAALTGIDSLTSAEHRVATLAAQGLSNREIAQQLYVTRRTVETHLTHVFSKLGVAARADLAAHLADL
jgi:DNA-binding NarL/FixJ family response regulator